jgi:hypothetical protein
MRKAFRVATAFTGAAACAAAFTPAAATAAATTAKTQIGPDAFHRDCPDYSTTSVHLYWPASKDHGPTCVGQLGTTSLASNYFSGVCTGNNSGDMVTSVGTVAFIRSFTFVLDAKVNLMKIGAFGGGFECGPYF